MNIVAMFSKSSGQKNEKDDEINWVREVRDQNRDSYIIYRREWGGVMDKGVRAPWRLNSGSQRDRKIPLNQSQLSLSPKPPVLSYRYLPLSMARHTDEHRTAPSSLCSRGKESILEKSLELKC